jgi:hypothetical protein
VKESERSYFRHWKRSLCGLDAECGGKDFGSLWFSLSFQWYGLYGLYRQYGTGKREGIAVACIPSQFFSSFFPIARSKTGAHRELCQDRPLFGCRGSGRSGSEESLQSSRAPYNCDGKNGSLHGRYCFIAPASLGCLLVARQAPTNLSQYLATPIPNALSSACEWLSSICPGRHPGT